MKIDSEHLRILRKRKGFTRPQLAKLSGITVRTIQRLEREPHQSQKTREDTVIRLAKSLSVEPGVLTGELPLPESDEVPVSDQAPKTRLTYDLIKRRYGVSRTEIINMAPLFFTLLAEGSLAWRREKLKEVEEAYDHLMQIDGFWSGGSAYLQHGMDEGAGGEEESIDKADLFGEHLDDDFMGKPFDSSKNNPFTYYLRKLAEELAIPSVVDVDEGVLNIASDFKFPHYNICSEELDHISQGSSKARRTLETGHVRISEIPEELMAEDAGERRVKWLEDKLPAIYDLAGDSLAEIVSTDPKQDLKQKIEDMESKHPDLKEKIMESQKVDSQKTNSETEKEGDDQ